MVKGKACILALQGHWLYQLCVTVMVCSRCFDPAYTPDLCVWKSIWQNPTRRAKNAFWVTSAVERTAASAWPPECFTSCRVKIARLNWALTWSVRLAPQPPERQIVVGICAMAKKSKSKPMKEILERLCLFKYITVVTFEEEVILNEPVENWPLCDCLISFHSKGEGRVMFVLHSSFTACLHSRYGAVKYPRKVRTNKLLTCVSEKREM